jgi:hypothetical protein
LEADPKPFEDVNFKPLWLGYQFPDEEKSESNVLALLDILEYTDGLYYSPLAQKYIWIGKILSADEGIVTGMAPGFQIDNLARLDHPAAEEAFLLYDTFFQDSGNVSEGQSVNDFGRVSYLYEPLGAVCDLTARHRSWEGAIDTGALLSYLFGLELDAPANRIAIAPHLPESFSFARMEGARLGNTRFDILVEDEGAIRRVVIDEATDSLTVDAKVSVEGTIAQVKVNGQEVTPVIESSWGRSRAMLTDLPVSPGQPLTIEVHGN